MLGTAIQKSTLLSKETSTDSCFTKTKTKSLAPLSPAGLACQTNDSGDSIVIQTHIHGQDQQSGEDISINSAYMKKQKKNGQDTRKSTQTRKTEYPSKPFQQSDMLKTNQTSDAFWMEPSSASKIDSENALNAEGLFQSTIRTNKHHSNVDSPQDSYQIVSTTKLGTNDQSANVTIMELDGARTDRPGQNSKMPGFKAEDAVQCDLPDLQDSSAEKEMEERGGGSRRVLGETPESFLPIPQLSFRLPLHQNQGAASSTLRRRPAPRRNKKIDFTSSLIFQDNNQNAELYRSQIGDQKHRYRNRYKDMGGPASKKMSYHTNVSDRALKIAGLGIDPTQYLPHMQRAGSVPKKIIFAGKEIDNKNLDFRSCERHFKVLKSYKVQDEINEHALLSDAK